MDAIVVGIDVSKDRLDVAVRPNIWGWLPGRLIIFLGDPDRIVKFVGVFGCGALFYLYRDSMSFG